MLLVGEPATQGRAEKGRDRSYVCAPRPLVLENASSPEALLIQPLRIKHLRIDGLSRMACLLMSPPRCP